MFRTVPLSIIRSFSLYTQQRCMSYSLRAGSGWVHIPIAVYSARLLMIDTETVRNM